MNTLSGKIQSVNTSGELSLVKVICHDTVVTAIVIDTPISAPYLNNGSSVKVLFKETEVVIGTGDDFHISLQNKFTGTISSIEKGVLLSKVVLKTTSGFITSVITSQATEELALQPGLQATALIKTNEIMLSP